jgi:hypothetical protein
LKKVVDKWLTIVYNTNCQQGKHNRHTREEGKKNMLAIYQIDECGDLDFLREIPSWATASEIDFMVNIYREMYPEARQVFARDYEAEIEAQVNRQLYRERAIECLGYCPSDREAEYEKYLAECEENGEDEPMDYDEWECEMGYC